MQDPWFKFYASDWLAGTSGLTAAERGVYITIIALIYETGGPVKLDQTRLARRCGLPAGSFKKIFQALLGEEKLVETAEGITNDRAEKEIGVRQNERAKHQSGAQKTNAIRAEKSKQNQQNDERSAPRIADAYQKPEPERKEDTNVSSKKPSSAKRRSSLPEDWKLPREWGAWAMKQGMDEVTVRHEAAQFEDHHRSKGSKMVNWRCAWQTWVRNHLSWKKERESRQVSRNHDEMRRVQALWL